MLPLKPSDVQESTGQELVVAVVYRGFVCITSVGTVV